MTVTLVLVFPRNIDLGVSTPLLLAITSVDVDELHLFYILYKSNNSIIVNKP